MLVSIKPPLEHKQTHIGRKKSVAHTPWERKGKFNDSSVRVFPGNHNGQRQRKRSKQLRCRTPEERQYPSPELAEGSGSRLGKRPPAQVSNTLHCICPFCVSISHLLQALSLSVCPHCEPRFVSLSLSRALALSLSLSVSISIFCSPMKECTCQ